MPEVFDKMRENFNGFVNKHGIPVRIRFYAGSVVSTDFDDAHAMTPSGLDIWTSGIALPMTAKWGSSEAVLLQQGKILMSDKRLYIPGTVVTDTPNHGKMKIGIGSPTITEHFLIPDGIISEPSMGTPVYKKLYVRLLPTGSFIGE